MALPVVHFCKFGFKGSDAVVVGTELDGGTSLSGISEPVQIDGGGYWQWTLSNGSFGGRESDRRDVTLDWRALNASLAGGGRIVALLCDRHHQPVEAIKRYPFPPYNLSDQVSDMAAQSAVLAVVNGQTGGLNCTILDISLLSEKPLRAGMRFTHVHATWGERCYEIMSVAEIAGGYRVKFQPPVRGGIAAGNALDFETPRCVMRRVSAPSNALDPLSLTTSVSSLILVEDMRLPAA